MGGNGVHNDLRNGRTYHECLKTEMNTRVHSGVAHLGLENRTLPSVPRQLLLRSPVTSKLRLQSLHLALQAGNAPRQHLQLPHSVQAAPHRLPGLLRAQPHLHLSALQPPGASLCLRQRSLCSLQLVRCRFRDVRLALPEAYLPAGSKSE